MNQIPNSTHSSTGHENTQKSLCRKLGVNYEPPTDNEIPLQKQNRKNRNTERIKTPTEKTKC